MTNKIVVYTGLRAAYADKGKVHSVFYEINNFDEDDLNSITLGDQDSLDVKIDLDDPILFSDASGMVVGGIYKIPVEPREEGKFSWLFGRSERIGHWPDKDKIASWQAATMADRIAVVQEKSLLKKDKMDYLLETLLPLREEYSRLKGNSRLAFEVRVLAAIRRRP